MGCSICKPEKPSKVENMEPPNSSNRKINIEDIKNVDKIENKNPDRTTKELDQVVAFSYSLCFFQKSPSRSRELSEENIKKLKKLCTLKEKDNSSQYSKSGQIIQSSENDPNVEFDNFFEKNQLFQESGNHLAEPKLKEESFHSTSIQQYPMLKSINLEKKTKKKKKMVKENSKNSEEEKSDQRKNYNSIYEPNRKESVYSELSQNKIINLRKDLKKNKSQKFSFKSKIANPSQRKSILSGKSHNYGLIGASGKKISDIIGRNNEKKKSNLMSEIERQSNREQNEDTSTVKKIYAQQGKETIGISQELLHHPKMVEMKKSLQKSSHQSEKKIEKN